MSKERKETKNVNIKLVIMFITIQHCHYLEDHECVLLYSHRTFLAFSLRQKKLVFFLEIGQVEIFSSLTHPHRI